MKSLLSLSLPVILALCGCEAIEFEAHYFPVFKAHYEDPDSGTDIESDDGAFRIGLTVVFNIERNHGETIGQQFDAALLTSADTFTLLEVSPFSGRIGEGNSGSGFMGVIDIIRVFKCDISDAVDDEGAAFVPFANAKLEFIGHKNAHEGMFFLNFGMLIDPTFGLGGEYSYMLSENWELNLKAFLMYSVDGMNAEDDRATLFHTGVGIGTRFSKRF